MPAPPVGRRTTWNGQDNVLVDRLKADNHAQAAYSERYPSLAHIIDDEPAVPKGNVIARNIASGCRKWIEFHDKFDHALVESKNGSGTDAGFVDATKGNFALNPDAREHSNSNYIHFQKNGAAQRGPGRSWGFPCRISAPPE